MMRYALAACAALALAGCVAEKPASLDDVGDGDVGLVAVAPDGTNLWAVVPEGSYRVVYFASGATATTHSESCGKNCSRTVDDIVMTVPE